MLNKAKGLLGVDRVKFWNASLKIPFDATNASKLLINQSEERILLTDQSKNT